MFQNLYYVGLLLNTDSAVNTGPWDGQVGGVGPANKISKLNFMFIGYLNPKNVFISNKHT